MIHAVKLMRKLTEERARLAAATEAHSEVTRSIHRESERIGRGRSLEDEEREMQEFIKRARCAGAAE